VVRDTPARTAAALVASLVGGHAVAELIRGWSVASVSELVWEGILPTVFVFGSAVTLGSYLRGRDTAARRATQAAVAAAQQRERDALARELHDVVAHHVGGIIVQAQAAQVTGGGQSRVLPLIERAGSDALSAMRRVVGVLRDGHPDGVVPARSADLVADLRAVADVVPDGPPVRLTVELTERIPDEVAGSVLRVVQESVTNARRHAGGADEITVTVRSGGGAVRIRVTDDGRPGGPPEDGGFGLVGMRERIHLLGGRFAAGPRPGGGWQVTADVPLQN